MSFVASTVFIIQGDLQPILEMTLIVKEDLAPCYFYLLGQMKNILSSQHFRTYDILKLAVLNWIDNDEDFYFTAVENRIGHLIGRAKDWFEVIGSSYVTGTAKDFAQLKQALTNSFLVVRNRSELEAEFYSSHRRSQAPSDFVYKLLKIKKILNFEMTEENLVNHIIMRLSPQERRHQSKRRPPLRLNWRERSAPSSLVENNEVKRLRHESCKWRKRPIQETLPPGARKMTRRKASVENQVLSGTQKRT
ncbi:uncharacterized protein NPIL_325801 [Nephila pilipes]|uniref:Retrotransposon gag domain-containing protein n=1 Tax=Nephila pilipes TaxID=299642 RepID=A0A8X6PR63_NEPPI|nr:uncharacterized protein NPIL_325801 [Nephila pilipes]